jgi:hypothetical protein
MKQWLRYQLFRRRLHSIKNEEELLALIQTHDEYFTLTQIINDIADRISELISSPRKLLFLLEGKQFTEFGKMIVTYHYFQHNFGYCTKRNFDPELFPVLLKWLLPNGVMFNQCEVEKLHSRLTSPAQLPNDYDQLCKYANMTTHLHGSSTIVQDIMLVLGKRVAECSEPEKIVKFCSYYYLNEQMLHEVVNHYLVTCGKAEDLTEICKLLLEISKRETASIEDNPWYTQNEHGTNVFETVLIATLNWFTRVSENSSVHEHVLQSLRIFSQVRIRHTCIEAREQIESLFVERLLSTVTCANPVPLFDEVMQCVKTQKARQMCLEILLGQKN